MRRLRISLVALGLIAAGAAFAAAQPAQPAERPHTWDGFAERHDVDGDGSVTREELMSTLGIFERLDADGDGVITDGDFAAHRDGMALAMLARRADDDEDGDLTRAELDDWFADRDRNDDGVLDREDFAAAGPGAMRRGPGRHPRHATFHGAFDADGDGSVEKADLTALFDRYDADGDGTLSAEERPEVEFGGMRHHRGHRGGRGFGPGPGPGRGPGRG